MVDKIPMCKYLKTVRENSFHFVAPRLFNKLPRKLRDDHKSTLLEWKIQLDKFLNTIPDQPSVSDLTPGLCNPINAKPSNSLYHWIPYLGVTNRRNNTYTNFGMDQSCLQ